MRTTIDLIEERLDQLIPQKDFLSEAIRYALLGPGKRIRPLLVIASAETFGADPTLALDPACAIEMVHAFSLIHDDLPCMDDDDYRRGRKSLHRAFPEAIALLAGDALLSEAYLVLARAKIDPSIKVQLIETLGRRIGKEGMTGGQALDMHPSDLNLDSILEMQCKKTGDLLSCALEFGPLIAKKPNLQEDMRQIGLHVGLAYQIRDDLEDAHQKSDEIKPTPLSLLGEEGARKLLTDSTQAIEESLKRLPQSGQPIAKLLTPLFK